jgi:glycine dehydrogenase subunit 1
MLAGVPVSPKLAGHDRGLLVAVTEIRATDDLDRYVAAAAQCFAPEAP